jgi:hypothetical protein
MIPSTITRELQEELLAYFLASQPSSGYLPPYKLQFFIANHYPEISYSAFQGLYDVLLGRYDLCRLPFPILVRMNAWDGIDPSRWSGRIFREQPAVAHPMAYEYLFTDVDDTVTFHMLFSDNRA